jgi:hypothetical protein
MRFERKISFKKLIIIVLRTNMIKLGIDTLHVIISKSEHYWWKDNNYTEKLVTERLSQTTYYFSNI